jgi:hypothetical protein
MLEGSANRLDTEQEREQEQEQEKEVEARRDQQIEVEKFVDREYSRQEEVQRPWPFSILAKNFGTPGLEHPFYKLKDFKLRHQEPLEFDETLFLSSNYFNPNWTGLRRVKNVVMVLEYAPSTATSELRLRTSDEARVLLSRDQEVALAKAHSLLGFHANAAGVSGMLNRMDLRNAVCAVLDVKDISDDVIDGILEKFSETKEFVTLDEFRELLSSGYLYPKHVGRHWVAVSLAEAETIRRILHLRKRGNDRESVIANSSTQLALRYSPISGPHNVCAAGDGGMIFDASWGWQTRYSAVAPALLSGTESPTSVSTTGATIYEASIAHSSFRFFDCDMHFPEASLNVLIQVLRSSTRDRERFFLATIGCRRRMERKWQETPLAKVFLVSDEWLSLKQKAQALFVIEALKARNLTLWEAFTAFDYDNNGMLSPSEFYGALVWLGVPGLTAEDVVDFLEAVDKNRDGMIDYKEYMDMLAGAEEGEDENANHGGETPATPNDVAVVAKEDRVPIAKVEPFGAEELREIMIRRKQAEMARLREDRIRRQAYKDALDVKVFEEELEQSKKRKGGANPLVFTHTYTAPIVSKPKPKEDEATEATEAGDEGVAKTEPESADLGPAVVAAADTARALTADDKGITGPLVVTDFKYFTNQLPLRCAVTGKSTFFPVNMGTLADKPVKPLKCKKNHVFSQYNYYWACCEICKKQNTAWACWQCSYFVCGVCYDGDKKCKEAERRDPAKHPTFLRCAGGCSFTVQIPSAGGADAQTGDFSVTLEMRIEKLPPKGNMQSLLRFTMPDATQARRIHRTSVFINPEGRVTGRALLTGGEVDDKASKIIPGKWQFVTVVVQPEQNTLRTYINGALCHVASDIDAADLRLQHKLVVFGGGKQAQSRGGDIRRLQLHNSALSNTEIMSVFLMMANDNPGLSNRIALVQAWYRGYHQRRLEKEADEAEKAAEAAALEAERAKAAEVEKALEEAAAATAAEGGPFSATTTPAADGDGSPDAAADVAVVA